MKSIILSIKGIQNLNNFPDGNEDFTFFYSDEHSFKMKINYSEIISPKVSKLRKIDPTTQSLHFNYHLHDLQEYFSVDIISKLQALSSGNSVNINQSQGFKLQIASILLENAELFQIINDSLQMEINETNLDQYLHHLTLIYQISPSNQYFNYTHIIEFISSHFISIEKSKLASLPKPILHSIISCKHLKLENEDALFDFILQIFPEDSEENDNELNINNFLEKVNFLRLSETKLKEAFNRIKTSQIGRDLLMRIFNCYQYFKDSALNDDTTRYRLKKIVFKPSEDAQLLNGIIRYLTKVAGGNVHDKGLVTLSSSSIHSSYNNSNVKFACDLDDKGETSLFHSLELPNSWLQYDFGERRVRPTHYQIRGRPNGGSYSNPRNWILEGSNTANENDWKKLDERKEDPSFMCPSGCQTFEVRAELEPNESFRFFRITQNGLSTDGRNWFMLSALEFYGDLYDL